MLVISARRGGGRTHKPRKPVLSGMEKRQQKKYTPEQLELREKRRALKAFNALAEEKREEKSQNKEIKKRKNSLAGFDEKIRERNAGKKHSLRMEKLSMEASELILMKGGRGQAKGEEKEGVISLSPKRPGALGRVSLPLPFKPKEAFHMNMREGGEKERSNENSSGTLLEDVEDLKEFKLIQEFMALGGERAAERKPNTNLQEYIIKKKMEEVEKKKKVEGDKKSRQQKIRDELRRLEEERKDQVTHRDA